MNLAVPDNKVRAIIDREQSFLLVRTRKSEDKWTLVGGSIQYGVHDEFLKMKMRKDLGTILPVRGLIDRFCIPSSGHAHITLFSAYAPNTINIQQGRDTLQYKFFSFTEWNGLGREGQTGQTFTTLNHLKNIGYFSLVFSLPRIFSNLREYSHNLDLSNGIPKCNYRPRTS